MVKPYKYHVLVCTASGAGEEMYTPPDPSRNKFCGDKGGDLVRQEFWQQLELAKLDNVKVTRLGCMVQHKCGPVVVVYPEGIWYAQVTVADVGEIVNSHLLNGQPVERLVYHRMNMNMNMNANIAE
jgi:(2Fe-2S) ferredoxin